MTEAYEIQYAEEAIADIKSLRAYDQRLVMEGVQTHLKYEPRKESKSRIKAMVQPFWSQYRLRVEDFRVYYDVSDQPRAVYILRVLEKATGGTPEKAE